jgi:MFS family permease
LVIASLVTGAGLLIAFPFIEQRATEPLFRLDLFKIRAFSMGNIASFLSSMARGGLMIMLIVLLQGIWLPLHGYSFESTPFWAGIFMIPMTFGAFLAGPLSGWLSDKRGARMLATVGMLITGITLIALAFLQVNFAYLTFGLILFVFGVGSGMFLSPNTASIMNSVPPDCRGVASGMRATLANSAQMISQAIFFTILIVSLNSTLPGALSMAVINAGAPLQVAQAFSHTPATSALFGAFLGYNPIQTILGTLPSSLVSSIPNSSIQQLTANTFFPNAIADPFMTALRYAFIIGAIICFVAAAFSLFRGGKYVYGQTENKPKGSNEKRDAN